jgi:hypothetical protein
MPDPVLVRVWELNMSHLPIYPYSPTHSNKVAGPRNVLEIMVPRKKHNSITALRHSWTASGDVILLLLFELSEVIS